MGTIQSRSSPFLPFDSQADLGKGGEIHVGSKCEKDGIWQPVQTSAFVGNGFASLSRATHSRAMSISRSSHVSKNEIAQSNAVLPSFRHGSVGVASGLGSSGASVWTYPGYTCKYIPGT